ncbi:protein GVQW3 [Trichonephila clavipes]|nr:protein GVQW3 [Trichonephila clavipes]
MDKRAVIKFYATLGKSASETYQLMKQVYGDCCLSRSNVFVWHKRFLDGCDAVEDDQRSGRPISSRTPEIIEKVKNFVANDRCASLRMMVDSLNINKETIRTITHE